MKKRIFACLLAFCLISACLGTFALEDEEEQIQYRCGEDYYGRLRGQNITLNVYNWGEYISNGEDDSINVNKEFERLTGIKVNYTNFASNEELYAKLKSGSFSYDIIIPSDYMIAKMIAEDMLLPLDFSQIPNFELIMERFVNPEYDPQNQYSAPYTWGTVGLIYNREMLENLGVSEEEAATWDILWDERLANNILMFSNSRDAFGIAQKKLGYSFNSENPDELRQAAQLLKEQKFLVQAYVMDEIFDKMQGGEAAIAPYYAGDALMMMSLNEDLGFVVPQEGTNLFSDGLCIPSTARNKEAAQMYINFMLEPAIGKANCEYIGYSTPNQAVYDMLEEDIKNDGISYPDDAIMNNTETFKNLSPQMNTLLDELWTEILSTDENQNPWMIPTILLLCVGLSVFIQVRRHVKKKRDLF